MKTILSTVYNAANSKGIQFNSAITTNGLLINQNMLDFCKRYNLNQFQITLDGNQDRHDKVRFISNVKGSYEKILQNIFHIADNRLSVTVRINCSVETLLGIPEILKDFEQASEEQKKYITFNFYKVWQVGDDFEFDEELFSFRLLFRKSGFKVKGGIYDTVINSCYADKKNHATINYNGEVFKCTARDFKSENKEGNLNANGLITWNEKYNKRFNSKFRNAPCEECCIFPLCGGGCSQQALEHENKEYCIHSFNESSKLKAVLGKFLETIASNEIEIN